MTLFENNNTNACFEYNYIIFTLMKGDIWGAVKWILQSIDDIVALETAACLGDAT